MRKILIAGMPGVGKSTLFRAFVEKDISCVNYAGTSVPVSRGKVKIDGVETELIDIPGTYGLTHHYENELVARRILVEEKPDVILQVADTKNLKRMLAFTGQLAEFDIPLVLVLNMVDEADQKGLKVKRHILEEKLATRVVETIATDGVGISALHDAVAKARVPQFPVRFPPALAEAIKVLSELIPAEIPAKNALAALCLSDEESTSEQAMETCRFTGDSFVEAQQKKTRLSFHKPIDRVLSTAREACADRLFADSTYQIPVRTTALIEKIGDLAREPFTGMLILFALLTALYYIVGQFAAGVIVDFMVKDFFGTILGPHVDSVVALIPYAFIREMITGKYGLYPLGLVPSFGLVLPIIVAFYLTFGFIEDSGYFSRLSILLDRLFNKIGLNGKAMLPIILGFSCVSMATIATRVLETKKERFIAIFLLSLGVPCSAKLSVILVVLAHVSIGAFMTVCLTIFSIMIMAGVILSRIMPSETSQFIMEVPPIRIPSIRNVLKQTYRRSMHFVKEATPLFFVGAISLFTLDKVGFLLFLEHAMSPLIKGFLGLPEQFAEALIMGFLRGEAGIAILKQLVDSGAMNTPQLVVALLVTLMSIPCVTNFMLILKDLGAKSAIAIIVTVSTCAILTGGAMNHTLKFFNIVF